MTSQAETVFLLKRAEEEAIRAVSAAQPEAAMVHQELSKHYSVKAIDALAGTREDGTSRTAIDVLASPP